MATREFPFVDPITGQDVVLVVNDAEPPSGTTTIGVRHGACDQLAQVVFDLDAFYCQCGRNGRVSGRWAVDCVQSIRAVLRTEP